MKKLLMKTEAEIREMTKDHIFEKIAKVHKQSADNPYREAFQGSKTPSGMLSTASLNS